ncbi:pRL2-8 [Streptomyces sp. BH105]|uniref:pRL2-8 n=1 Tax=Streptomyces sp. BH105 TaxID=3410408 RepID=UPI003CF38ED6
MSLFGIPPCPKNQCPQCWEHAYNSEIHRRLKSGEECRPCLDHMATNCDGFYRR